MDVCLFTGGDCAKEKDDPKPSERKLSFDAAEALRLFNRCRSQWRHGFNGPTGLDYASCRVVAEAEGMDFGELLEMLQGLETEWLTFVDEKRREREEREKQKPR